MAAITDRSLPASIGRSKFESFVCNGRLYFTFVTPFLRSAVTGNKRIKWISGIVLACPMGAPDTYTQSHHSDRPAVHRDKHPCCHRIGPNAKWNNRRLWKPLKLGRNMRPQRRSQPFDATNKTGDFRLYPFQTGVNAKRYHLWTTSMARQAECHVLVLANPTEQFHNEMVALNFPLRLQSTTYQFFAIVQWRLHGRRRSLNEWANERVRKWMNANVVMQYSFAMKNYTNN